MLLFLCTRAQELPEVVPMSPDMASISKFAEVPVSYHTGIPNISIPVYTINSRGIKVPISLSYHAGGIRVDDIASQVGLGWNLIAGGQINRVTRQLPDDLKRVGYIHTSDLVEDYKQAGTSFAIENQNPESAVVLEGSKEWYLNQARTKQIDFAPDDFHFNFINQSGKFLFNQDKRVNSYGEVVLFPDKDIKITPVFDGLTKIIKEWEVITQDGTMYFFGENDYSDKIYSTVSYSMGGSGLSVGGSNSTIRHITSWKLTRIKAVNGNEITFKYEKRIYDGICTPTGQQLNGYTGNVSSFRSKSTGENYSINEIIFNEGKILFEKESNARLDLKHEKALKNIKVINNHNKEILNVNLVKDYFVSTLPSRTIYGCNSILDNEELRRRLYLKELVFSNGSSTTTKPYKYEFKYNERLLPHRYSNAQDYWGYYNGKSNANLIPKIFYRKSNQGILNTLYNGAKRFVDPLYTQASMLQKIIYPEGGVTEFIFENNEIDKDFHFSQKENLIAETRALNVKIESEYDQHVYNKNTNSYTYTKEFTVSNNLALNGIVSLSSSSTLCDVGENTDEFGDSLPLNGCDMRYTVTNMTTNLPVSYGYNIPLGIQKNIIVTPGNYRLSLHINNVKNFNPTSDKILIEASWEESIDKYYIGGLRIKNISSYIKPSTVTKLNTIDLRLPTTSKSYTYTNEEGKSTGWIQGVPVFKEWGSPNQDLSVRGGKTQFVSSNNLFPLVTSGNNYLGYYSVTETQGVLENRIQKKFDFSVFTVASSYPTAPLYYEWESGNPIKTTFFKEGTINYEEITHYNYNASNTFNNRDQQIVEGIDLYKKKIAKQQNDPREMVYQLKNGIINVNNSIKKEFFNNGLTIDSFITRTDYLYSSLVQSPTETIISNSKGQVLKTKTYYAGDVNNTRLLTEHRIAEPLKVESYKNKVLLSTQETAYATNHNIPARYLPKYIRTKKGLITNLLEDRVVYHKYDAVGNPVEVSKKDGTKIYYVWGYNQTHPIAKIEGYNKIDSGKLSIINNAILKSNKDNDRTIDGIDSRGKIIKVGYEGNLREALMNIRTSFREAQVTTFTYDPLIGVTSITGPRGQTIYYDYDAFNRLLFIKDIDGNIVKENQYNYKN